MNSFQVLCIFVMLACLSASVLGGPYNPYGEPSSNDTLSPIDDSFLDEYKERLENYLMSADKRACIRRGGSCDGRPSDCCQQSMCRCNLWGTNCRCQRAGLFSSLGRRK